MSVRDLVEQAFRHLGKARVIFQIHDSSFPATASEDVGRGTPYGDAGHEFIRFARDLGFDAIQLGPQGATSRDNPSPYDGTAFSRSFLALSFPRLTLDPEWKFLVDEEALRAATKRATQDDTPVDSGRPPRMRTRYAAAFDSQLALCERAYERYRRIDGAKRDKVDAFVEENRAWLEADALFEVLSREYGTADWLRWTGSRAEIDRILYCPPPELETKTCRARSALREAHSEAIERYALVQYLVHRQHDAFLKEARQTGLSLYADLQVGLSPRDGWRLQPLFLQDYLLGAPPSRTNREGQPWGYPVLDPNRYGVGGLDYLRARAEKLFGEFDGLRIDHPQGLVCPWVYRSNEADPVHAVQNGARLFSSPDRPDLARYAIARRDQLAEGVPRHADGWVRELDAEQVDHYATKMHIIMGAARDHGLDPRSVACETLSTQPYPLKRVMEEYGLGRFRVTQKMDVTDPNDVYRTDRATPPDWVMMSNHDTPPIWARAREWREQGDLAERAGYLAGRLAPSDEQDTVRRRMLSNTGEFVHAMFADLLLSAAENVSVFFADLLGMEETYNAPGTVGPQNWSLRVPSDYRKRYGTDRAGLRALDIPYACVLALRSPLAPQSRESLEIADALDRARAR